MEGIYCEYFVYKYMQGYTWSLLDYIVYIVVLYVKCCVIRFSALLFYHLVVRVYIHTGHKLECLHYVCIYIYRHLLALF